MARWFRLTGVQTIVSCVVNDISIVIFGLDTDSQFFKLVRKLRIRAAGVYDQVWINGLDIAAASSQL